MGVRPFADGLRNANFLVRLDSTPVVLRVYCAILRCVWSGDRYPAGGDSCRTAGLRRLPAVCLEAIAQAARSAGEALAAIGRIGFARAGWLAPGAVVTEPLLEGANPMPRFVDRCLSSPNLQRRTTGDWREPLVHGDFKPAQSAGAVCRRKVACRRGSGLGVCHFQHASLRFWYVPAV
jgi:hypothetical protein